MTARTPRGVNTKAVLKALEAGPLRTGHLVAATGLTADQVRAALTWLISDARVHRTGENKHALYTLGPPPRERWASVWAYAQGRTV